MSHALWITEKPLFAPQSQPWNAAAGLQKGFPLMHALQNQVREFDPIDLDQMNGVALLNRIDTKFVLTTPQMLQALAALRDEYWILSVAGQRLNRYRTLYFDTPEFSFYHAQINGRAERYKVRSREYVDSRVSFFEVKHRTRKDRTIKQRIATVQPVTRLSAEMSTWLQDVSPLDGMGLQPTLWNTFTRLTLVSKQNCERLTLDVDLAFHNGCQAASLEGIVIAEVKMDAGHCSSPFFAQMRAQKIRRQGFSKYAMGVALLFAQVKKNAIKPKMLQIQKMMRGSYFNEQSW